MFVSKEEFLNSFVGRERDAYIETIEFFEKKSTRDGRLIAMIADDLLKFIQAYGDNCPELIRVMHAAIQEHYKEEVKIMKARVDAIRAKTN